MVTVLLRRNLAGLLHSTGAKKPNETNKTVVLLQIYVCYVCTYKNVVSFHLFYIVLSYVDVQVLKIIMYLNNMRTIHIHSLLAVYSVIIDMHIPLDYSSYTIQPVLAITECIIATYLPSSDISIVVPLTTYFFKNCKLSTQEVL